MSNNSLSKNFKKAFGNKSRREKSTSSSNIEPSSGSLSISSPINTVHQSGFKPSEKLRNDITRASPTIIVKQPRNASNKPIRRPPPKPKNAKFKSLRDKPSNDNITKSDSTERMVTTRRRSLSLSETQQGIQQPSKDILISKDDLQKTPVLKNKTKQNTSSSKIKKKEPKFMKNPKKVETTHKIFTYLCTRHPWFAENWFKEDTEITDQTFQDIVAILSGEKTSIQVKVKEAWTKQEFNLNTSITENDIKKLLNLRTELFTTTNGFIKEIEEVLPSYMSNLRGDKTIQYCITREPKLQVNNILNLYKQLMKNINSIDNQEMVEELIKELESKTNSCCNNYKPKEKTIEMASQMKSPLYVNNLVIVKLEGFLKRFSSINTQLLQTIGTIDNDSGIITHRTILELLSCIELSIKEIRRILRQIATSLRLSEISNQNSTRNLTNSITETTNIWEYLLKHKTEEDLRCSTLNGLIIRLTCPTVMNAKFMEEFFSTYRSFTTPDELFYKLMERYNVPLEYNNEKQQIQMRVCVALKYWLNVNVRDFGHGLLNNVRKFIQITLQNDGHTALAERLENTLIQSIEKEMERPTYSKSIITLDNSPQSSTDMFINSSVIDIAQQLTLIAEKTFHALDPTELLNLSWSKPKLKHLCPHVLAMIERNNTIAHWVATTIMFHEKVKERSLVITKFINIGEELRKMNNYDTLMGIIAGLSLASVSRLKFSYLMINDAAVTIHEELREIMNPQGAWKEYRNILKTCPQPSIPYMGVYLTDLTFIEDGNSEEKNSINFRKRELVGRLLQEIQRLQHGKYPFETKEPLCTYLIELPFMDQNALYKLSLQREPRNSTIKDIL